MVILSDVLFKFDSDRLSRPGYKENLREVADAAGDPRGLKKIVIEGHTCSIGTRAYNRDLSLRRAKAIRRTLSGQFGIPLHKIIVKGMGEDRPVSSNSSVKGRRLNRRVEFSLYFNQTKDVASR